MNWLNEMLQGDPDPAETREWIESIKAVIDANPGQVTAYKAKPTLFGWFVGQVMKSTGGKANPKVVNELLRKALDA